MSKAKRGEVWQIDFGMTAKVRPALLLTDESDEDNELDVVTVVLHTTALSGEQVGSIGPQALSESGCFSLPTSTDDIRRKAYALSWCVDGGRVFAGNCCFK